MNRMTSQDGADFQRSTVNIDLDIVLGTAGATTGIVPKVGAGILSIVSGGSGVYTVTFQDGYTDCLNVIENVIQAAYSATGAVYMTWTTDSSATATPSVVLTARTAAGAAVQPATGDRLKLTFRMATAPLI
jgi:hypothetical protein